MTNDLELRHLRALAAVVDHGGYTRAARALGLSQSTVSETLLALERVVGAPVLERGRGGPPRLTPAGAALLEPARAILALAADAMARVGEASRGARLTLAVGANESVSSYLLPPALGALRTAWPAARVQVSMGLCDDIREGVRLGRLDLGLTLEPAGDGPMVADVVRESELALFVSPAHPLAGRSVPVGELWDATFYLSDMAGSYTAMLRRALAAAGLGEPHITAVGSVEGVKRGIMESGAESGAAGGTAVGVLPRFALEAELSAGSVALVRPVPALPRLALRRHHRAGEASPLARALLAELSASWPAPPGPRPRSAPPA